MPKTTSDPLQGISRQQQRELADMLARLAALWAELTQAAASQDQTRVDAIQREIAECRARVDQIKRAGTRGSA